MSRYLSTLQRMAAENERLRREKRLGDAFAVGTWIIVTLIAVYLAWGRA